MHDKNYPSLSLSVYPRLNLKKRLLGGIVSLTKLFALGIFALTALMGGEAQAGKPQLDKAYVDDDGKDAFRGGIKAYFGTIKEAIQAVKEGGTVYVLPGLYKGTVNIGKSLKLIALADAKRSVPSVNNLENAEWPVVLETEEGNAIQAFSSEKQGVHDVVIRGFHIRKAGGNGIHVQGRSVPIGTFVKGETSFKILTMCENITIAGNKIENTVMDGIKVNACHNVAIVRNTIANSSLITKMKPGQMEQAIDFMLSGNVSVRKNRILENAIGLVVKGGTVNAQVVGNEFLGPFQWTAQSGEPAGANHLWSGSPNASEAPWTVKQLVVRDNIFANSNGRGAVAVLRGCQDCSYVNNAIVNNAHNGYLLLVGDDNSVSKNVCISNSGVVMDKSAGLIPNVDLRFEHCPVVFPKAKVVPDHTWGYDVEPIAPAPPDKKGQSAKK